MVASNVQGPLSGIRILDLTHVWAGPLAVRTLGDLGATVVKVERPLARGPQHLPSTPVGGLLGDPDDPAHWNRNGVYIKLQRNRFGLALDFKTPAGKKVLLELVEQADVLVENFSATAMIGMGLGYEALHAANPKLIYVTMPGYGSTGPYSERVAFGTVIEPLSALTHMMGYSPDDPVNSAQALPDAMGGMHTVGAVCSALLERQHTGEGARIEISLHETGVTMSGPWLVAEQLGEQPHALGNRHPNIVPHGVFRCKGDDQWLALACEEDTQWQSLVSLIGGSGVDWDLTARRQHIDEIESRITAWTAELTKDEATDRLQALEIAAGPVNNAPEMVADEQLQARDFYAFTDRFGAPMQGDPVHRDGASTQDWLPSPFLGEHNHEVLKSWLNYDEASIAQLESDGVLVQAPPV